MNNEIGQIIRAQRESRGWSLDYLSEQIGTNVSGLSKMENGYQKIDSEMLIRISDVLNTGLDDLLNRRNRNRNKIEHHVFKMGKAERIAEDLLQVLIQYNTAKQEAFGNHTLSNHVRKILKSDVYDEAGLDPKAYHVVGSVGQGQWAEIPWLSIFMRDITISATKGYYIVYLFNADGSGVYVSLNQGWTYFKDKYGTKNGVDMIKRTAGIMRNKLHTIPSDMQLLSIDLKGRGPLAKGYESGHICGKYYDVNDFPSSDKIVTDLLSLINVYIEINQIKGVREVGELNDYLLLEEDGLFIENSESEESFQKEVQSQASEDGLKNELEDRKLPRRLPVRSREGRESYSRRSFVSAEAIKEAGFSCIINGTHKTFTSKATLHQYVESHHIVPMSKQDQFEYELDQTANIAALCPNCHRLIHLGTDMEREDILRQLYLQRRDRLENIGIEITFSQLKLMYGFYP
ncbi:MrcB family domain-containing protein [Psychrobacillus psychrotolerans]|uniref:MrcB family domain-containing protein n=1 Tax=Psychrobacillus psychrotolerans TaxID=126156 RepID=UPI003314DC4B